MLYRIAADVVVVFHFLWILFLVFGAVIGRHRRAVGAVHGGGILFALVMQVFGWYCPFTYLEVWLRANHDPSLSYSGSFIVHYVEKLIYINISPATVLLLTIAMAFFNCCVYAWSWKKKWM